MVGSLLTSPPCKTDHSCDASLGQADRGRVTRIYRLRAPAHDTAAAGQSGGSRPGRAECVEPRRLDRGLTALRDVRDAKFKPCPGAGGTSHRSGRQAGVVDQMYLSERLHKGHDTSAFKSGKEPSIRGSSCTRSTQRRADWVDFGWHDGGVVIAYYTLIAHLLTRDVAPRHIGRGDPDQIPAALLARLALAQEPHGQGLGGVLLAEALGMVVGADVAISYGLVDAIDDQAARSYQHYGFREMPVEGRLPRKVSDIVADLVVRKRADSNLVVCHGAHGVRFAAGQAVLKRAARGGPTRMSSPTRHLLATAPLAPDSWQRGAGKSGSRSRQRGPCTPRAGDRWSAE